MSLLGSIGKIVSGVASVIPGVGGIVGKVVGGVATSLGGQKALPRPAALPALTGVGRALPAIKSVAKAAALPALAVASSVDWKGAPKKRRRRKGISARDLSSFKRVARLVDKFAAPVHRMRKSSFKPHTH